MTGADLWGRSIRKSVLQLTWSRNSVKHITYLGRSPHEAFFTPDGKEVWVVVRGENYVAVLDGTTYQEKARIVVANGPGMTIFSPDGKYGYVCFIVHARDRRDHRRRPQDRRQGPAGEPILLRRGLRFTHNIYVSRQVCDEPERTVAVIRWTVILETR
jgi:DNA-binding beta-propeller fold protein YncE